MVLGVYAYFPWSLIKLSWKLYKTINGNLAKATMSSLENMEFNTSNTKEKFVSF